MTERDDSPFWRIAGWAVAAIMCAAVGYGIVCIPIQLHDAFIQILQAQGSSNVLNTFLSDLFSTGFMRPLFSTQVELLFKLAENGHHYFWVYKGFHLAWVIAAFVLFVRLLRLRTRLDFCAAVCALFVFTGIHTFLGNVWEAFPVNHYLEVSVLCLFVLELAHCQPKAWVDLLASFSFIVAALTLETGLVVWVIAVAAWLVGLRGISRRGLVCMTLLMALYVYFRMGAGPPSLLERPSGFGTRRLDPSELVDKFGEHPSWFYAYNVVSSFLSVLLSEPRQGVWVLARKWSSDGEIARGTALNIVASFLTTSTIVWFASRRLRVWSPRKLERPEQIVVISLAAISASSVISFPYTKDATLSGAGMFYALAAYFAVREAACFFGVSGKSRVWLGAILIVMTSTWAIRAAGLHYHLRRMAFEVRRDWLKVEQYLEHEEFQPRTPEARALVRLFRDRALEGSLVDWRFPQHPRLSSTLNHWLE